MSGRSPRLMDMGLDRLAKMIYEMGRVSEAAVTKAIEGYVAAANVVDEVYELSQQLRLLEDEVTDLALEIIARYQPVAKDLRFIRSCMEIAYGFSRFGRYAYDISKLIEEFGGIGGCPTEMVLETAEKVKNMIRISVTSFRERDVEAAERLEKLDDEVDEAYRAHVRRAITDPSSDKRCDMAITLVLRYLERIADHATYIGEAVHYVAVGERAPRR
ncbi:MAG: PhoU domain-containing protein [Nitrososphaerota archaeon]